MRRNSGEAMRHLLRNHMFYPALDVASVAVGGFALWAIVTVASVVAP
jgi:hypothetical protein